LGPKKLASPSAIYWRNPGGGFMNRRRAIQAAVTAAAAAVAPRAHAAGKDIEVFVARWDKAKVFTLQVADAMPAASYGFKPKDEMRSYAQLMQHTPTNNASYISRFKAGEIPDSLNPPEKLDKDTTKKYLTDSFDFCAGVLRGLTDADLDKSYP